MLVLWEYWNPGLCSLCLRTLLASVTGLVGHLRFRKLINSSFHSDKYTTRLPWILMDNTEPLLMLPEMDRVQETCLFLL